MKRRNFILIALVLFSFLSINLMADEPEYSQQDFLFCPDPFRTPKEFYSSDRALATILSELSIGMNIKGVVISGKKSYIIVNDEIISEGDEWRGLKVEKIFPDKMVLRYKDEIKEFNIKQEEEIAHEK